MNRGDGVSAGDRSLEVKIDSSDTLRKVYELFDELGLAKRYSEELGEVEASIHGEWLLFYVDRRVLDQERAEDRWFEDAQQIAERYWRQ